MRSPLAGRARRGVWLRACQASSAIATIAPMQVLDFLHPASQPAGGDGISLTPAVLGDLRARAPGLSGIRIGVREIAADPRYGHGDEPDVRAHAVVLRRRHLERLGAGARRGATRGAGARERAGVGGRLVARARGQGQSGVIAYARAAAEQ